MLFAVPSRRVGAPTLASLIVLGGGCGQGSGPAVDAGGGLVDAGPRPVDQGCPALFADAVLADYHVDITPEEWTALWDEFIHVDERDEAGLELKPYHPIRFRWQDGPEIDAMIRLRGQWSWREAVQLDDPPKMQFVIAFDKVDPDGRFMGQRKVELDMPRGDHSFLRQRLALSALRELGFPAQCAASARLLINGEYYGLYLAIERMDKEFLERLFPGADQGDLWDGGAEARTNQDTYDHARIDAYWNATSAAQLAALSDLDYSITEWAAEAVINNGDGTYGGNHNYFLYDHPSRGFLWLPHDLDTAWNFRPADGFPIFPLRDEQPAAYYLMVMDDPVWRGRYVAAIADVLGRLGVVGLEDRVDRWAAQIARAAADDPNKPFTTAEHLEAIDRLRGAVSLRVEYLNDWLACLEDGGPDGDGDQVAACHDCDDADGAARPGAAETSNQLDDDCDGRVDEGTEP